jgi:gamma-glutamyltranspeptidase
MRAGDLAAYGIGAAVRASTIAPSRAVVEHAASSAHEDFEANARMRMLRARASRRLARQAAVAEVWRRVEAAALAERDRVALAELASIVEHAQSEFVAAQRAFAEALGQ